MIKQEKFEKQKRRLENVSKLQKSRFPVRIAIGIISALFFIMPAYAEEVKTAVYSDILAMIDYLPIPSYNVNGTTYVVAEDLNCYGFDVNWNSEERCLNIVRNRDKAYYDLNDVAFLDKEEFKINSVAYTIIDSDIKTYMDGILVPSYNINGRTIVSMDDLSRYGYLKWQEKFIDFTGYPDGNPKERMNFAFFERGRAISLHMTYFDLENMFNALPEDEKKQLSEEAYENMGCGDVVYFQTLSRKEDYFGQVKDEKKDGLGKTDISLYGVNAFFIHYIGWHKDGAPSGKGIYTDYSPMKGMWASIKAHLQIGNFNSEFLLDGFGVKCDPTISGQKLEYGLYENGVLTPDSAQIYPNSKYYAKVINKSKFMIHAY